MNPRQGKSLRLEALDARVLLSGLGFADPFPISPVDAPDFVTAGDFNGDGKPDLATSSFAGSSLTILLGTGKGGFKGSGTIELSAAPDFVTSADINGDGKLDLLTANFTAGTLSILPGNGDATFGQPRAIASPGARTVVVADFTGDTVPDLISAKSFNTGLTMLPGLGQGTFHSPFKQATSFTPSDIVPGDFDNNGTLDLAAVDFFKDTLYILSNVGGGQFQVSQTIATGAGPTSITAGDFNSDGKPDLATADFHGSGASVFINNGNGTFGAASHLSSGRGATFALAVDINHDSKPDLLVANATVDTISAFVSNANGTFQSPVDFATGASPRSIATADFNRDGHLDMAAANQDANSLTVVVSDVSPPQATLLASGPVTAAGSTSHDFTVSYSDDLVFGADDLDDDDILVTGPNGFSSRAVFVSSKSINLTTRQATYRIAAPGGFWEPSDNGAYQVAVRPNAVFDSSGNAAAAQTLGTFQAALSDVGNGLVDAANLGDFGSGRVRNTTEYVGTQDRNDYYKLRLLAKSQLYVKLYGLVDDADLQLLNSNGQRLAYSKRSASAIEYTLKTLAAGTYYARVLFSYGLAGTGYNLRVEASAPPPPPTDNNTIQTATDLGSLASGGVKVVQQGLGVNDRNDYYRLTLGSTLSVQFKLYELTDDADLQLLDSQGNSIAYSKKSGSSPEAFTRSLARGTYYARVLFKNGTNFTNYRLRIAAS